MTVMVLDLNEIAKIAHLARLALTPEQAVNYAKDLSNILELVTQINAQNTDGLEPLAHPVNIPLRLRQDLPTEPNLRDELLTNAPLALNGLYLVPKVIE